MSATIMSMRDVNDDRGPAFRAYVIVMFVVAVVAITLRFISRGLFSQSNNYRSRIWWDDWLALAATPFVLTSLVLAFVELQHGLGRHAEYVSVQNRLSISELIFVGNIIYYTSLYLTKASALFFFSRVFPKQQASKGFTILLWATHCLNTTWVVGAIFGTLFICTPIEANWNGTCNSCAAWRGSAIASAAIDLIILLLPLPMIWGLQTSTGRKSGMTAVFALGYSVIAVSLGRTIFVITNGDEMYQDLTCKSTHYAVTSDANPRPDLTVTTLYWQCSEAPISLLGVCLPAMLALGRRLYISYLTPIPSKVSDILTSRSRNSMIKSHSGDFSHPNKTYQYQIRANKSDRPMSPESESIPSMDSRDQMIQNMSALQYPYTARIHGGRPSSFAYEPIPDAIRVDSRITIKRHGDDRWDV
ncbi:hypothetical protein F5Y15DRAFT_33535 [Xylariaceae sp. FL0016]|nr:hypothetical protein F5Y15DRAFT_33535 [Xylariaceae sp. FL0016]